jgi:hypothetical protein
LFPEQFHRVFVNNDGQGAYKILLIDDSLDSDFYLTLISTMQNKMVFEDKIFLISPSDIWFNCELENCTLGFLTWHFKSIQNISLNNYYLNVGNYLESFYGNFSFKEEVQIFSPKGDIIIEGSGYFSLDKKFWFHSSTIFYNNLNREQDFSLSVEDNIVSIRQQ